jgi:hypothetical protein
METPLVSPLSAPGIIAVLKQAELIFTFSLGIHKVKFADGIPGAKFILQALTLGGSILGTAPVAATSNVNYGFCCPSTSGVKFRTTFTIAPNYNINDTIIHPLCLGVGDVYAAAEVTGLATAGRCLCRWTIAGFFVSQKIDPNFTKWPLAYELPLSSAYPPIDNA